MSISIDWTETTRDRSWLDGRVSTDRTNPATVGIAGGGEKPAVSDKHRDLGLPLTWTMMANAACLAMLACVAWIAIDGLGTFVDQITALSPTQLLNAMAGR